MMITTTISRPFGITDAARNQALANVRPLWDDGVTFAFGTDTQAGPAQAWRAKQSCSLRCSHRQRSSLH